MPEAAVHHRDEGALLSLISPVQRLALAYAPQECRKPTLAVLALDVRLASIARRRGEPLLAQLRLAWWRDRLGEKVLPLPKGEPVLAALGESRISFGRLVALVDGWEAMLGEQPLEIDAFRALADGRAEAFAALAAALENPRSEADSAHVARSWALADIAARVSDSVERRRARDLADVHASGPIRLPRALRPLTVLHGIARRQLHRERSGVALTAGDMLAAIRLGIAGR